MFNESMTYQETGAFAPIPTEGDIVDAPKSNTNIAELETTRVLFCAQDAITDTEKRELPFKAFGGMFLPHVQLLGNNGMLYRCQLTRLPKYKMIPDWRNMLGPIASTLYEDSFVQTVVENGVSKDKLVSGFLESDPNPDLKESGEFKNKRSNHIVYRKRYAAQDCMLALKRPQMGYAPGGVVEITALKGASAAEVREAQLFFFPKWDDIKKGVKSLPLKVKDTELHISKRIAEINSMGWETAKVAKYYSIGRDMLRSVTEFNRHALTHIRGDEIIVKDAATKGAAGVITNSDASELYLEQTGTRRKEDLITGQSDSVAELTREMREERAEKAAIAEKQLLLEERKQYTAEITAGLRERDVDEEIRLGMRKAEVATSGYLATEPVTDMEAVLTTTANAEIHTSEPVEPEVVETALPTTSEPVNVLPIETEAHRPCGKPKLNGEPCERLIRNDQEACFRHVAA